MTTLFENNASSTLAAGINNTDDPVTLSVQPGDGDKFPSPTGGDTFLVTLEDASGAIEIMLATARTSNDITATRAQEGTTAFAFAQGSRVECRVTAGTLNTFVQENSPIDMGGNTLSNASVDSGSSWNGGTMQAGVYQSVAGSLNNAITVPDTDTQTPHVNGDPIVLQSQLSSGADVLAAYNAVYPVGIVVYMSNLNNPQDSAPAGFGITWAQLTSAYGRFLKLSGSPNVTGNATNQTDESGDHSHGESNATLEHALTEQEMPIHVHDTGVSDGFYVRGGTGIPATGGAVGIIPFPTQTQPTGDGQPHTHGIEQDGAHTHPITNLEPLSYTLVPWTRTN